ncbi:SHOCT domain-containing protein [Haloarchaeobius salinus]|uniref:SHOCT domain-containing protein n=1 Tax=Haloarchaeobius salinus TaxID=1198298 RepID=UPI00210DD29A|nr:SHOCT domain-containing protein [Haloarchaeobius salinus]
MGRSFSGTVLQLLVWAFVLLVILGVVTTVVGLVLGVLSTVFTAVVVLGLVVLFGAIAVGLLSLFVGGDGEDEGGASDWFEADASVEATADTRVEDTASEAARLRERYVAGEIDEVEFERRLDLLLDDPEAERQFDEGDDRERKLDW